MIAYRGENYLEEKKKIGELLIEAGILSENDLAAILVIQKNTGKRFGEIVVENGNVTEDQLIEVLEFKLNISRVNLKNLIIDPSIPRLIGETIAKRHTAIPIYKENNVLTLAMNDPLNIMALDDVRIATGMQIKPVLATNSDILSAIDRFYGQEGAEKAVEDLKKEFDLAAQILELEEDTTNEVADAPVVRLVNSIIQHAVRLRASDIHIEPAGDYFRVRFRVDGDLQETMRIPKSAHSAVTTRIKIMSSLDIAERRLPQDGRIEMNVEGKEIDLRISILPTVHGEKIVMRLLGRNDILLSKSQLGFTPENIALFEKIIKNPNGIILVSGPTGSGKTTTLYAILRELNKSNTNVITVEDPVEYRLEGVNQVQVNNKINLTFANGLRSILRQDPDVIMIGEIRDSETAQIAVRAAITGHLVLSTIHTNDAASTVSRLVDMGIEPFLVSSSLVGIVAQRLVKRICPNCKFSYSPSPEERLLLKQKIEQPLYKGKGCSFCGFSGYKGRIAVHEVLLVDNQVRMLIDKRASIDYIRSLSAKMGTTSLRDNCTKLVLSGGTTIEELIRVTYSID